MPKKTQAGAEAAAKWKAFRRYLDDIEKYENLKESREIFDRYLPYTVAFGLEQTWVRKFAQAEAATPGWFDWTDVSVPRGFGDWHTGGGSWTYGGSGGGSGGGGSGGIDLPDLDMPDLQGSSDRAGRALQSGSSGLMDVLKVAGAIIEIAAAFSGGGSGGGSSGGGGGGFD
jgi:hypothetical protein